MIQMSELPSVNAALNATSAVLLVAGYACIRRKRVNAHRVCMIAAMIVSCLFLMSYLYYHAHAGRTRFTVHGWIRSVYFSILLSHTVLASVTALVLVPMTAYRAVRQRFDGHKAIARWTLPIWLYVSVTGVLVYFILYHWYAPA